MGTLLLFKFCCNESDNIIEDAVYRENNDDKVKKSPPEKSTTASKSRRRFTSSPMNTPHTKVY